MKPRSYKELTGYINPCVYMAIIIPILTGCVTTVPPPQIIRKTGQSVTSQTVVQFTPLYLTWKWDDDRVPENQLPTAFDVEVSPDLINWTLLFTTTESNAVIQMSDPNRLYYRVGVHNQ